MLQVIGYLTSRIAGNGNIFRHVSFSTQMKAETQNDIKRDPNKKDEDKLFSQLEIELRGIDPKVLKSFSYFATIAAKNLGIEVGNCWASRKAYHDRITLLKSVHIFKKHRVQYEIRTHFRFMNFYKLTGSTLYTYLEYIERNVPEGVNLNATNVEIQKIPSYLMEPPPTKFLE